MIAQIIRFDTCDIPSTIRLVKIRVEMGREDLLEHTKEILENADALFDGQRLLYIASDGSRHRILFEDNGLTIERSTEDMRSKTKLYRGGRGKTLICSQYGDMCLETELVNYDCRNGYRAAEYRIFSGGEAVTHQVIYWRRID